MLIHTFSTTYFNKIRAYRETLAGAEPKVGGVKIRYDTSRTWKCSQAQYICTILIWSAKLFFFLSLLCMLQIVSIQYLLTQDLSIVPKSQEQIRFWLKLLPIFKILFLNIWKMFLLVLNLFLDDEILFLNFRKLFHFVPILKYAYMFLCVDILFLNYKCSNLALALYLQLYSC